MMTETTTSSSSSAVKSARLEAVTTTPPSDESAELDKAQREAIAQMVRQAKDAGVALTGPDGLLKALTAQVVEAALDEELNEHLGYDKHDPVGRNGANSRNGYRPKTVVTDNCGEVTIAVPRDRDGSFEPVIVAKRQRRLGCRGHPRAVAVRPGLVHRGDRRPLRLGSTVPRSARTRSRGTSDRVVEEMTEWTNRPLQRVYAAVVLDAIHVKVRDGQACRPAVLRRDRGRSGRPP